MRIQLLTFCTVFYILYFTSCGEANTSRTTVKSQYHDIGTFAVFYCVCTVLVLMQFCAVCTAALVSFRFCTVSFLSPSNIL